MSGQAQTPGQAAFPYRVGDKIQVIATVIGVNSAFDWMNVESHGSVFCIGGVSANPDLAAAQERPAPELAAVLADRHDLSALNAWQGAEITRLRERLAQVTATEAVTRAEAEALRQALDKRNAQHKALLGKFSVSGHGIVVTVTVDESSALAVLDAGDLARAYFDAGYPVRDDLRHLAK